MNICLVTPMELIGFVRTYLLIPWWRLRGTIDICIIYAIDYIEYVVPTVCDVHKLQNLCLKSSK